MSRRRFCPSLVGFWPLKFQVSRLFGPHSGLTPGGFPSGSVALVGSCPYPSCHVWLAVPRLCFFLCALFVHCSMADIRCFAPFVGAFPGLLAPHGLGILPFPFFSGLFCFVFPCPVSLALLCLCGGACGGVLFPRVLPSIAGIIVSRS